jgi:outer membrane protein assembly factor BamD (BamD/ComL family)
MLNWRRLVLFFMALGLTVPCFAMTRSSALRERRGRIKKIKNTKIPLADLIIQKEEAEACNDSRSVIRACEKICSDYKTSDRVPEAYYTRGVYYKNDQQFTTASKMFMKIVKRYSASKWFTQAIEYCFRIAQELQAGVRPRYFGTIPGFCDFDSAVKNYELVVQHAPYSYYAPKALLEIAELHIRAKRYDSAIAALEKLIDVYADSVEVPQAYLKIAEIYSGLVHGEEYNQGGAVAALRYYGEFCALFPSHESVAFATERMKELEESIVRSKIALGDFYFNSRHNGKAAKMLYRTAIDYAPYVTSADVAREKIQAIRDGAQPRSTPVDFLFTDHKPEDNDEFVYAATVEDRVMDQKDGRVDPVNEASVTPFIKSENVIGEASPDSTEEN